MEGTPLLRLFLPRPGFTRYLMQRSRFINLSEPSINLKAATEIFLDQLYLNESKYLRTPDGLFEQLRLASAG